MGGETLLLPYIPRGVMDNDHNGDDSEDGDATLSEACAVFIKGAQKGHTRTEKNVWVH